MDHFIIEGSCRSRTCNMGSIMVFLLWVSLEYVSSSCCKDCRTGEIKPVLLCMILKSSMMRGTVTVLLITHELLRNTMFCFAQAKKSYPPSRNWGKTLQAPTNLVTLFKSQLLYCSVTTKQHHHLQRWFGSVQYIVKIINIELGYDPAGLRISHCVALPSLLSCTECIALSVAIAVLRSCIVGICCSEKKNDVCECCTFLIWSCFFEKMYAKFVFMWLTGIT